MKKNHLFGLFAMAAFAFVSCSQDEVVSQSPDVNKAIEFGTYVGRDAQSRAEVIKIADLAEKGFGVFAYYNTTGAAAATPNFMNNQQVKGKATTTNSSTTYSTTEWEYSPLKYWPNNEGDKLTFFAYAPYTSSGTFGTASGVPTLSYNMTVNDGVIAISGIDDVLYLTNTANLENLTKQTVEGKVNFAFGHALSRVAFAARVMVDEVNSEANGTPEGVHSSSISLGTGTTVTINSVKLTGKFHTAGTLNLGTGVWTFTPEEPRSEASYVLNSTSNFIDDSNVFTGTTISTTLLNKEDSYIMLYPQNFASANKVKITVDYTVETADPNLTGGKSTVTNTITSEAFNFDFQKSKAYKFTLHLGMTSVKLSAEMSDWSETDYVVNVPLNTTTPPAGSN